jgi:hypothetical protein
MSFWRRRLGLLNFAPFSDARQALPKEPGDVPRTRQTAHSPPWPSRQSSSRVCGACRTMWGFGAFLFSPMQKAHPRPHRRGRLGNGQGWGWACHLVLSCARSPLRRLPLRDPRSGIQVSEPQFCMSIIPWHSDHRPMSPFFT